MYVCTYVCMYVRTYVCMYVRMYVCIYIYIHIQLCTCTSAHICISICTCTYIYIISIEIETYMPFMQQSAHLSLSRVHMAYSWRIASSNWVRSQLEVSSDASNRFIWLSSPLHLAGPNILFLRHFVACKGRWFVLNRPKHCDFPWSSQRIGSIENLRLVVEEEHSFVDQPSLQPTAIMFKFAPECPWGCWTSSTTYAIFPLWPTVWFSSLWTWRVLAFFTRSWWGNNTRTWDTLTPWGGGRIPWLFSPHPKKPSGTYTVDP